MILGYNTNGLAHHDPISGLELLAELGYRGVGLTVDHGWLAPHDSHQRELRSAVFKFLHDHSFINVIETGARFLLNSKRKHFPTLLESSNEQVQQRVGFLKYCIDLGEELNSDCVSIWSGKLPDGIERTTGFENLLKNLEPVLNHAEKRGIDIGFEPEPGMLIDTTTSFQQLLHHLDSPRLKMTMDIGHLHCLGETPLEKHIRKWKDRIVNVHIEDMKAGVHDHLMFGDGEIDFVPVIAALKEIGYERGVYVELSRHSHNAAEVAGKSFQFLSSLLSR